MADNWLDAFPHFKTLDPRAAASLRGAASLLALPAHSGLLAPGSPCRDFLFVISGVIRVQMISQSGREIVLYRIGGGETCILTTSCLLANEDYPAEAVTETAVVGAALPAAAFHELLDRSAAFRSFVFQTYGRRIADLMLLIEEVAFRRIDVRLAECLVSKCRGTNRGLAMTHQQLAVELGSAREVVSRQLKEFERRGWLTLARGRIDVVDVTALQAFLACSTR